MAAREGKLRVAFISGGLGKGGAEKQFIYMLRALQQAGVEILVLTLTEGEHHEQDLYALGIDPVKVYAKNPAARLLFIRRVLSTFRPHFIQATHFYASLYSGTAGWFSQATSIGAVRNDFYQDLSAAGRFGPLLLRLPDVFLANSNKARENAQRLGLKSGRVHVLPNVIDLQEFDRLSTQVTSLPDDGCIRVISVARLMPVKRLERFLEALALARQQITDLRGILVGSGPEETRLKRKAQSLGLNPGAPDGGVEFLGSRDDIPAILKQSDIFLLTSDREGFPNVLLEAMAAAIPIVATPAGEVAEIMEQGHNGYVVPFDDLQQMAETLVRLAKDPSLRQQIGLTGRQMVETRYSFSHLGRNMLDIYRSIAAQEKNEPALSILSRQGD